MMVGDGGGGGRGNVWGESWFYLLKLVGEVQKFRKP